MIFFKKEETKKKVENLINQLKYEYKFVFVLAPTVRGFFPIIESLLIKGTEVEISKESIVYLIIASLAQLLEKTEEGKMLMSELKQRGVEGFLPKVKKVIQIFKRVVNFFLKKAKMMTKNYLELFAYTALFVPFALTFSHIINSNNLGIDEFINAFSENFGGKFASTAFGIGAFTIKHFIRDIFSSLKKLNKKPKEIVQILNSTFKKDKVEESTILNFEYYSLLVD